MYSLTENLQQFSKLGDCAAATALQRGIEKESLRVDREGLLAQSPHPVTLGSTLTHPHITTDFSEALLELITAPQTSADAVLSQLENIHRFVYQNLGEELLWVNSMPCMLGHDADIPLARYGSSNIARMKTIYRRGLGYRYGRLMQTIAGIHYNWSLSDTCWARLHSDDAANLSLQDFKTERYFGLIRNFRRFFWLLLYLFGAAPAVCRSFVSGRQHRLIPFGDDEHSLHLPHATSLRMGRLGYQSDAQQSLVVCYNDLRSYIETLRGALTTPYAGYQAIGVRDARGKYLQLNPHLLQIENEFYSSIRPKRSTLSGEAPLPALWQRGVEYVEVRCIDLNPFLPLGIDAAQIHFLDTFLLYCLLRPSPKTDPDEYRRILANQSSIVERGRDPQLCLKTAEGDREAREWARALFVELEAVAEVLDGCEGHQHRDALAQMRHRLDNPDVTPAARILEQMQRNKQSYFQTALSQAREHRGYFLDSALDPTVNEAFIALSRESLAKQQDIEARDEISFEDFLRNYYQQYQFPLE